jgi:hypothetical protein
LVLEGVGHRLTAIADESGPSGLVDGKRIEPIAQWLLRQQAGGQKP